MIRWKAAKTLEMLRESASIHGLRVEPRHIYPILGRFSKRGCLNAATMIPRSSRSSIPRRLRQRCIEIFSLPPSENQQTIVTDQQNWLKNDDFGRGPRIHLCTVFWPVKVALWRLFTERFNATVLGQWLCPPRVTWGSLKTLNPPQFSKPFFLTEGMETHVSKLVPMAAEKVVSPASAEAEREGGHVRAITWFWDATPSRGYYPFYSFTYYFHKSLQKSLQVLCLFGHNQCNIARMLGPPKCFPLTARLHS